MWAELQTRIVEKLRADLPAGVKINTAADIAGVTDRAQLAPGAIVIYAGFTKADESGGPAAVKARVQLNFFVCASGADRARAGNDRRGGGSGERALRSDYRFAIGYDLGITPATPRGASQFIRLESPLPPEYDGGYCMAPLAFSVLKTVKSNTVT